MRLKRFEWLNALLLAGFAISGFAQSPVELNRTYQAAPPPAPPVERSGFAPSAAQGGSTEPYSIGNVSAEEQLYLEFINRTRANPQGEVPLALANPDVVGALEHFGYYDPGHDTNLLVAQFATIPVVPPIAFNAKLNAAARRHVIDMKTSVGLNHTGSDGSTFLKRVQDTGYPVMRVAENIYHAAEYTEQGHFAFEIDWGNTPSGIQEPPGHRNNIHSPTLREIGIAVDYGSGTVGGWKIGPQLVVQDFATAQADLPFITGVCYFDLNGNNFYDVGEGINGVLISTPNGGPSAISSLSGGYSLPLPGNGTYSVTFSIANAAPVSRTVNVSNKQNVKVDYTPAYTPPTVSGPAVASIGKTTTFTFSPVPGAVSYDVRQFQQRPAVVEGAENGTATVTVSTTGEYQPIVAGAASSGSAGFHLAHLPPVTGGIQPQTITLNPTFTVDASTTLEFQSKLAASTVDQKAKVQVSEDDGATWTTVYNQAGLSTQNGVPGESAFNLRTVSLAQFAGKFVKIRFNYAFEFGIGLYVAKATLTDGWLFDDILLRNGQEIFNVTTSNTTSTEISLQPSAEVTFGLQARANMPFQTYAYGPVKYVDAVLGPAEVKVTSIRANSFTQFVMEFELLSGKAPSSYTIEARNNLDTATPWGVDSSATITALGNNRFSVNLIAQRGGTQRYYRVRPNP